LWPRSIKISEKFMLWFCGATADCRLPTADCRLDVDVTTELTWEKEPGWVSRLFHKLMRPIHQHLPVSRDGGIAVDLGG